MPRRAELVIQLSVASENMHTVRDSEALSKYRYHKNTMHGIATRVLLTADPISTITGTALITGKACKGIHVHPRTEMSCLHGAWELKTVHVHGCMELDSILMCYV